MKSKKYFLLVAIRITSYNVCYTKLLREKASQIVASPIACLKKHSTYFENVAGKRVANLCGSNGRKAVPIALLGAEVTVFDISEEHRRWQKENIHWEFTIVAA